MARLAPFAAAFVTGVAAWAAPAPSGELRLRLDTFAANPHAASVLAHQLSDVVPVPPESQAGVQADLRLRLDVLQIDVRVESFSQADGDVRSMAQVNEMYLSTPMAGLQFSAGRRVVQWDVGFGFRPNDLVQQDDSRALLPIKLQGRSVLQLEKFGSDSSVAMVWVNPQHAGAEDDEQRGPEESALAAMGFARRGSTDLYGFARLGERTGASVGAAAVAVIGDSLALHASARAMQRHDGWAAEPVSAAELVAVNPWRQTTLGHANQLLLGANWTGEAKQGVLVEWWYDGTTLSDAQWDAWLARSGALSALVPATQHAQPGAVPALALAGNLAWQDSPLAVLNQRRETVFVRLSWQPAPWLLTLDTLYNPADSGRVVTAGVQWQGNRVRVNAALRWHGGPDTSLAARPPQRRQGLLVATWAY